MLKRQAIACCCRSAKTSRRSFERWDDLPSLMRNRFRLHPMTGTQAFEAIPKKAVHTWSTRTVAEEIVRFVGSQADPPRDAPGDSVSLLPMCRAPHGQEAQPLSEISDLEPALLSLVCRGPRRSGVRAPKKTVDRKRIACARPVVD